MNEVKREATSTVNRGKAFTMVGVPDADHFQDEFVDVRLGDSLACYPQWATPTVIISDGGYGVLGFEGDTSDHLRLPEWYEPHIAAWSRYSTPQTTLWFWNSEIGWATVHPILEKYGWRYVNANIWDKGKAHIAGNVNTAKIRRFPVVTEVCVQYSFEARIDGLILKQWLLREWKRTGLALKRANEACGVKDAAVRKYLDQGHLWYFPPAEAFERLQSYANAYGAPEGRPYFSRDGRRPMSALEWASLRYKFHCPYGMTNVWQRNSLHGKERVQMDSGRAIHLNQKPLDLIQRTIEATSEEGDVVWEPFGGLFTACLAAYKLGRRAFGAELDPTYFQFGIDRLRQRNLDIQMVP